MGKAFITDYITNPDVEIRILSDLYTDKISDEVEVLMVWHHEINSKYLKNHFGLVPFLINFRTPT